MNAPSGRPPGTARTLATFAGISPRTARRWRQHGMPAHYQALAGLLAGELGAVDPAWQGFTLTAAGLVSPEGWCFTAGELRAVPLRYQREAALERDLRALRDRFAALAAATVAAAPSPPGRPSTTGSPSSTDRSPPVPWPL